LSVNVAISSSSSSSSYSFSFFVFFFFVLFLLISSSYSYPRPHPNLSPSVPLASPPLTLAGTSLSCHCTSSSCFSFSTFTSSFSSFSYFYFLLLTYLSSIYKNISLDLAENLSLILQLDLPLEKFIDNRNYKLLMKFIDEIDNQIYDILVTKNLLVVQILIYWRMSPT